LFEELENNLHPALQRRLLSYIREFSIENSIPIFLTTHSSVFIDFFSRDESAKIIHVTSDGSVSRTEVAQTFIKHNSIIDDLDVRASDLLQANCIIWVEGPSDRIYVNRWVELESSGTLKEGQHYQCVFYGGRLLSHLSAAGPNDPGEAISIF
jgi:putative ATP-dependent endonuclease of the OLD family